MAGKGRRITKVGEAAGRVWRIVYRLPERVGPVAPLAPNATDEGRARNRRVELVER